MKRKYDDRNKRNFVIIMVLSLLVIGIFSLFIYKYNKASKIFYVLSAETAVQDINRDYFLIDEDATLKIRWNDNYYLMYKDNKIDLGKKVITYNTVTGQMKIYGNVYSILEDGKVENTKGETIVENVTDTKFYKLADREYLLVDRTIVSEDRSIEASNYLLVELDKMGNAKLSNNKLNLKTISPTVLVTSKYKFDIANEILSYGNLEIDLKKIIGTSNQYKSDDKKDNDKDNDEVIDNNQPNQGQGNGSGNGNGQGQGNNNQVINKNDDKNYEDMPIEEIISKTKMTSVVRVFEGLTQIDFDYVIYDPYNEYKAVYVEVTRDNRIEKIELNKNETHLVVASLNPDSTYRFKFVYTTMINDEEVNNTFDEMTLKTKLPNYSIGVQKISKVNNTLSYKVTLDENYLVDKVLVNMSFSYNYVDSDTMEVSKKNVSVNQYVDVSKGSKFVIGTFDIKDYDIDKDTLIRLNIDSVSTNGINLKIDKAYTFRFGR